ncbi:MAG: Thymidylate kinase [Pseudomonadota bacterium]|jgi:dTMP kinase
MQKPCFISFEGIDGAGKSTHIEAVAQWWQANSREVVLTREPGGTPLSETLREQLLHVPMDALTEALLMFAARREHLVQVIEPALARQAVVLCDRFTDATFAYQGGGRGFDWSTLEQLETMVQKQATGEVRQPDLTIWFDLDPAIAAQRLASARVPDKFESQPQSFFEAVRAGYAKRMQAQPQRFLRIDAAQSLEQVREQVLQGLHSWWSGQGS